MAVVHEIHGLKGCMSRRSNYHDKAIAESFFRLLKSERKKKKVCETREEARSDVFDYSEMVYNYRRQYVSGNQMPQAEYENKNYSRLKILLVHLWRFSI